MKPESKSSVRYRNFFLACAALAFLFAQSAFAQSTWQSGIADPTQGQASGLWAGVNLVTGLIYAVVWIAAAIVIAMGWFKWKGGDVSAAIFHVTGGAGIGFTPILIQWFRSF